MSEDLFWQWNNGLGDANNKIHGLKQPCSKPYTEEIRWLVVFWKWLDVVNFVCGPKERAMMAKRTLRQEKHAINLKEGLRERNQYTAKDLPSTLFSLIQSCAFACSLYSTYDFVQLCWWWAMLGLPTAVFAECLRRWKYPAAMREDEAEDPRATITHVTRLHGIFFMNRGDILDIIDSSKRKSHEQLGIQRKKLTKIVQQKAILQ